MQRLTSDDYPRDTKAEHSLTSTDDVSPISTRQIEHFQPLDVGDSTEYKLYKRRFIGLAQLALLNIISSWDWITFAPISSTAANFFGNDIPTINWLSTACLLAWLPVAPVVIWTLNRGGPKVSIIVASVLVLLGNWIRYGGTACNPPRFGVVMFGQILVGLSQPFVLAAPTRYSNLWFSDTGRVSATAVASLANPFGAALGSLIGPMWAEKASDVPNMVLYTGIMSSIICLPAPFIPARPPSPPSAIAAAEKLEILPALRTLSKNISFWLLFFPFAVYVGSFNATSSILNQILHPYGFSETDAGIAGALLIFVGLVTAAVVSPFVDRKKKYTETIKIVVPFIALMLLVLVFMPQTRSVAGPYVACAILGATAFSLLPCSLEYQVLVTHPVSPEITSTICWTAGQVVGAVWIIVMSALQGPFEKGGTPKNTMVRALTFQAVFGFAVLPLVYFLGTARVRRNAIALGAVRA
jgi:hypothetical protein